MSGTLHRARFALLADGPSEGERPSIGPGQVEITVSERFDYDQVRADVIDHYAYEGRTGNDPDTVVFTFRGSSASKFPRADGPSPKGP